MKSFKLIYLIIFTVIGFTVSAQSEIQMVNFTFEHSRRIPNNSVEVNIVQHADGSITLKAKSKSMHSDPKFAKYDIDTSFTLPIDDFKKIIAAVTKIKSTDIASDFALMGDDGTTCEIEFGGYENTISYKVWTPDDDTSKRKLGDFLSACKLILSIAKFDPKEILE